MKGSAPNLLTRVWSILFFLRVKCVQQSQNKDCTSVLYHRLPRITRIADSHEPLFKRIEQPI